VSATALPVRLLAVALAAAVAPVLAGAGARTGEAGSIPVLDGHPLGLNQGIGALPARASRGGEGPGFRERLEEDLDLAARVGTRWYRVHSIEAPYFSRRDLERDRYDFTDRDALIAGLQSRGIDTLVVLGPTRGGDPCRGERRPEGGYAPADEAGMEGFRTYVKRVVERYDGDGSADMPGLTRPVKWWQLDNEVDLHWQSCRSRGLSYATPEEYLALLRATRAALREADPEARLLTSHLVVIRREEGPEAWVKRLYALDKGAAAGLVDALDLHDYGEEPASLQQKLAILDGAARRRLPVWITESSVPGDPRAHKAWDPRRQARALVGRVAHALGTGRVQRMFWHSLKDAPPDPDRKDWKLFGSNSLFACVDPGPGPGGVPRCRGRVEKPVGAAFDRLSDLLEGVSGADEVEAGRTWVLRRAQGDLVAALGGSEGEERDLSRWLGPGPVRALRTGDDAAAIRADLEIADTRRVPVGADAVVVWRNGDVPREAPPR